MRAWERNEKSRNPGHTCQGMLSPNKERRRSVVTFECYIWDRPTQSQPTEIRPGEPLPHANQFPIMPEDCPCHPAHGQELEASQVNSCWEMFTLVHVASNKLDFNVLNRQKKIAPCCRLLPSVKLPSVGFCHSAWLAALEIRGLMQRSMLGKKTSTRSKNLQGRCLWKTLNMDIVQSVLKMMTPFQWAGVFKCSIYLWLACLISSPCTRK